jgi:hypothetical protein
MELNVRIAIPQVIDNKQVYKEIPLFYIVLSRVLSPHPIKIKISIRCVSVK